MTWPMKVCLYIGYCMIGPGELIEAHCEYVQQSGALGHKPLGLWIEPQQRSE